MGHPADSYFVRLESGPPPVAVSPRPVARSGFESHPAPRHRSRRRITGRSCFLTLVALALGGWFVWASQQPGGVSGTLNGFIDNVRGDVARASAGPDLRRAASYFDEQYAKSGAYPELNEEQMTAAGIGIDVDVARCGSQAVVLQTLTVSRLLLAGRDVGEVTGRRPCPTDLRNPAPWKVR